MTKDLKDEFWDRMEDVQAGMLSTGGKRAIPMTPYADPEQNAIWFITSDETDTAKAAAGGAQANLQIADPKAKIYTNIEGFIRVDDNREKLDELWSVFADVWFEKGERDPHVKLIRLTPTDADVWTSDGGAAFLFEIAKAQVTDQKPDVGQHGHIAFHA